MSLTGIKVFELAGLAPAPYCGMILADFGADVVRVDRAKAVFSVDSLSRGKRSIGLNLKSFEGQKAFLRLLETADVLIDPFRPGVMESMNLRPATVHNKAYGRLEQHM